jgi:hypothetical protein
MYPCPTVSSESNNKETLFTSREYCHRGQIVARVPRVGHRWYRGRGEELDSCPKRRQGLATVRMSAFSASVTNRQQIVVSSIETWY